MYLIEELENNKILMKNNLLVKARYNLSLVENRIFLFMLYKLQKECNGVLKCSIPHKEFKEIIRCKESNTIKGILNVLEELRRKPIFFKEEKKNKKGNLWGAYGFINGYFYDDELGTFNIEASEKIHEILREYLKMGYTPVNVQIWLSLNNSYSQRFYDLLRLWSGTKNVITYKIDEIKELLMLEDKYDRYNDFKRRVIIPAIKGLNDTGFFDITINENKIGRRVESIDFIVKDLDKRVYFDKKEIKENTIELDKKEYNLNNKDIKRDDFYVPNKQLFTSKTLSDFKNDFSVYDFKESKIKNKFYEAIGATLEKDDAEKIYAKSYNYFKKTLENKLNDLFIKENNNEFKKTKFHNFDETFTRYSDDEFDELVLQSQKKKFG